MSLYYEAASILGNVTNTGGSLKSRVYNNRDLKSAPAQLFALISEASKWSIVLKGVVERCGVLTAERKVCTKSSCIRCAFLTWFVAHPNPRRPPHARSAPFKARGCCSCRSCPKTRDHEIQNQAECRVYKGACAAGLRDVGSFQAGRRCR